MYIISQTEVFSALLFKVLNIILQVLEDGLMPLPLSLAAPAKGNRKNSTIITPFHCSYFWRVVTLFPPI